MYFLLYNILYLVSTCFHSSDPPPSGPPPYYGYPPPPSVLPAPGSFAYVPAPVMMPTYPQEQPQPTYVTNFIYPPQPIPEPVQVVERKC